MKISRIKLKKIIKEELDNMDEQSDVQSWAEKADRLARDVSAMREKASLALDSYADATAKLLKHDEVSAEDATRQVVDVLKGIVEDFIEEDLGGVIDDVYFDEVTKP